MGDEKIKEIKQEEPVKPVEKPAGTKKRPAKKSAKKKKEDKEVKRVLNELKKISNRCQLQSPVCTGFIEGADHTQKISPKNATNKKNIKGACNACNGYKEQHPDWAKANGHSVSRFDKKFLEQAS